MIDESRTVINHPALVTATRYRGRFYLSLLERKSL
jgi:hypothetical protein